MLSARRSDYGEAANNLALILASRGQADAAVTLLERLLQRTAGVPRPRT